MRQYSAPRCETPHWENQCGDGALGEEGGVETSNSKLGRPYSNEGKRDYEDGTPDFPFLMHARGRVRFRDEWRPAKGGIWMPKRPGARDATVVSPPEGMTSPTTLGVKLDFRSPGHSRVNTIIWPIRTSPKSRRKGPPSIKILSGNYRTVLLSSLGSLRLQ